MEIKKYYSIGEIARLSNTTVKNIRYYSDLGILKPAYTNLENGYRYYKYEQLVEITLIQFCLSMNMPLKAYKDFLQDTSLDYQTFLNSCFNHAKKKLLEAKRNMEYIESSKYTIHLLNEYGMNHQYQRFSPKRFFIALPCDYPYASQNFMNQLKKLQDELTLAGYIDLFDWGALEYHSQGTCQQYVYYEIYDPTHLPLHLTIFTIHSGNYTSIIKQYTLESNVFPFLDLSTCSQQIFLILRHIICTEKMDFANPIMEFQYIEEHNFQHQ